MPASNLKSIKQAKHAQPSKTTTKLKNGLPSSAFQDYADISLKVAMHINCSVNELRRIEHQDSIKPVSRATRRRYEDLQKILAAYDSSDWADVFMAGIPESEATSKVFRS
jgi:hypothetical protein